MTAQLVTTLKAPARSSVPEEFASSKPAMKVTYGSEADGRLKSIAVTSKPLLGAAGWGTDCWRAHVDEATAARISLNRREIGMRPPFLAVLQAALAVRSKDARPDILYVLKDIL